MENESNLEPKLVKFEEKIGENLPLDSDFSLYKRQETKIKYVEKIFVGPFHMMAISSIFFYLSNFSLNFVIFSNILK